MTRRRGMARKKRRGTPFFVAIFRHRRAIRSGFYLKKSIMGKVTRCHFSLPLELFFQWADRKKLSLLLIWASSQTHAMAWETEPPGGPSCMKKIFTVVNFQRRIGPGCGRDFQLERETKIERRNLSYSGLESGASRLRIPFKKTQGPFVFVLACFWRVVSQHRSKQTFCRQPTDKPGIW